MLVPFTELLSRARGAERAVGAFTAYNLETATAVLDAAEEASADTILIISEEAYQARGGPSLLAALGAVAERSGCDCCVQLDHVGDLRVIESALAGGVGAVMADGSKLPFDQNVELVARACVMAANVGAHVEAELGHIAGDEEVATATSAGCLTDPGQAAEFVERTGADCLAVSIGNVHGRYRAPPRLDWPRLDAVAEALSVPLSLHGASGLSDADVRRAIAGGVRKVNINTELRARYFEALAQQAPLCAPGAKLLDLTDALVDALSEVVEAKLAVISETGGLTRSVHE